MLTDVVDVVNNDALASSMAPVGAYSLPLIVSSMPSILVFRSPKITQLISATTEGNDEEDKISLLCISGTEIT